MFQREFPWSNRAISADLTQTITIISNEFNRSSRVDKKLKEMAKKQKADEKGEKEPEKKKDENNDEGKEKDKAEGKKKTRQRKLPGSR